MTILGNELITKPVLPDIFDEFTGVDGTLISDHIILPRNIPGMTWQIYPTYTSSILGNRGIIHPTASNRLAVVYGDCGSSNFIAEADFFWGKHTGTGASIEIIGRLISSPISFFGARLWLWNSSFEIRHNMGTLVSQAVTLIENADYHIKVTANGTSITATLSGAVDCTLTATSNLNLTTKTVGYLMQQYGGVVIANHTIDNFKVNIL